MVEVEGLTKRYAGSVLALDNVSFSIVKNNIVGLLGPNGAGKTTTIRIITGYLAPTSGKVFIDGIDMMRSPAEAKSKLGYMPENVVFYPELKVWEYLEFRAYLKGVALKKIRSEISRVMELCFISEVKTKLISSLSKGFRQRLGLADALLGDPKLIILDEPTIGLDPNQIVKIRKTIKSLGDDHTVIFSSHILSEVEAICDEMIIIHKGRILAKGNKDELLNLVKQKILCVEVKLQDIRLFIRWLSDLGATVSFQHESSGWVILEITHNEDLRERIFHKIVELKGVLRSMSWKRTSLEDVFVELTTQAEEDKKL